MSKRPARRKGVILMVLGALCMAAALVMALRFVAEDRAAGESSAHVLEAMGTGALEVTEPSQGDMPVVTIDGRAYIGRIQVPSVDVDLPVLATYGGIEDLAIAPAVYSGDFYTGGMVIAGHSYRSHFGGLWNVSLGDDVYLVNAYGEAYRYQVMEVQQLQPTQVEDLVSSGYDLSLFTCTPDSQARHTVRCKRVYE